MLLVDANVLLYAVNRGAREHAEARDWLTAALSGREGIGFSWTVLLAFLRISTHSAILDQPLEPSVAADVVQRWLEAGPAVVVEPTSRHLPLLKGLLESSGTAGNRVNDAHLAVLALEYGATVVSFDRDFDRFEGVSWRLPA